MGDLDPFGPTRRSGRVDDIGQRVELDGGDWTRGRRLRERRFEQQRKAGVVGHELTAGGRIVGIERDVRRPPFERSQDRRDLVRPPRQSDADEVAGAHATFREPVAVPIDKDQEFVSREGSVAIKTRARPPAAQGGSDAGGHGLERNVHQHGADIIAWIGR